MFICRVIGSVVSDHKHPSYARRKLLLVRKTDTRGELIKGTMVVVDAVNSGVGDWVIVASGGGSAQVVLGLGEVPVREVIVGIIDRVDIGVTGRR
jgi:microcompartment protein CcmK/EutM